MEDRTFTNLRNYLTQKDIDLLLMGRGERRYDERDSKEKALRYYSGNTNPEQDSVIQKTIKIINSMRDFYGANPATSTFFEANFKNPIMAQGWKIHISAKDFDSYMNLCEKLVPYLSQSGIPYKIVNPIKFASMENSDLQKGKYITIYTGTAENLYNLLSAIPGSLRGELMSLRNTPVPGEINVGGCIYARYGSFLTPYVLAPNGAVLEDKRGEACPDWINEKNFIKEVAAPVTRHMSMSELFNRYKASIADNQTELCEWFCDCPCHKETTTTYDILTRCNAERGKDLKTIYEVITENPPRPQKAVQQNKTPATER